MKNKILYILSALVLSAVCACDSYLDVVPKGDIESIDTEFEKRSTVQKWMKSCYIPMVSAYSPTDDIALLGGAEYCGGDRAHNHSITQQSGDSYITYKVFPALQIASGNQMAQTPFCNVWTGSGGYWEAIRYCNIFIDKVDGAGQMDDDEKKLWKAQVKAVKAFYYFDLMRRYGPIPLVDKNHDIAEDNIQMQDPRQPIDSVVNAIVKLCDEAIIDLPANRNKDTENLLFFSKESTAYLKAMTYLYAASPLFNGSVLFKDMKNKNGELLFPQQYDKEKWKKAAEACDEAIQICEDNGLHLIDGNSSMPNTLTNKMRDIEQTWIGLDWDNPEAIMTINSWGDYSIGLDSYILPRDWTAKTEWYDTSSSNSFFFSAPENMVELFYTDHGLPISQDKQWMVAKYALSKENDPKYNHVLPLGENILNLHRHREPRFYAMILSENSIWYRKTKKGIYDDLRANMKRNDALGTSLKRVDSDTPQNLTGYYIKKWVCSDFKCYNYYLSCTHKSARYIFRLPELYLASAEAWNEYLDAPNQHCYDMIDKVRERAGIPGVVEAWQTYSTNPSQVTTKDGFREIVHREWDIEFMFEGKRYFNLRRWMTAPQELNKPQTGWNILSETTDGFYNNYTEPLKVWTKTKFEEPKDYFSPIRAEEILISGQTQNVGW